MEKLNNTLKHITKTKLNFKERLTIDNLILLKSSLSDINNVITYETTIKSINWIKKQFKINANENKSILNKIKTTKPNTNGFDIRIEFPKKIIAEVKAITPINGGNYYGAAQRNAILDDAIKLKNGKKELINTQDYIKFIFLIDIGSKTDEAIKKLLTPAKNIRTTQINRVQRHDIVRELVNINGKITKFDKNKIYIKSISIET